MPTIAQAIEREENTINEYQLQLDNIDKRLRLKRLSAEQRSDLEFERSQLMKKKTMTEKVVGKLRGENRKTMLFSVLLMALGAIGYFGSQTFLSST